MLARLEGPSTPVVSPAGLDHTVAMVWSHLCSGVGALVVCVRSRLSKKRVPSGALGVLVQGFRGDTLNVFWGVTPKLGRQFGLQVCTRLL
jgi:hypothetical protein